MSGHGNGEKTLELGNLQDGVELEDSCANTVAYDLVVYNGNVGVLGESRSTAQNNSFYGDTYTITVNGATYDNKNGATLFE